MMIGKANTGVQALRKQSETESRARSPLLFIFGLLGFVMFAYGGYLTQQLLDPAAFPIRKIAVDGEFKHLNAEHVERVVSSAINGGFFGIDVAEVRARILNEPWIFDASVRRVWPDSIRVSISEQHAVARWGEYALLNQYADIFVPDLDIVPRGLVHLDGPIGTEVEVLSRYRKIQKKLDEVGLRVVSVNLSERRAWSIGIENGATLMFGRQSVDLRLDRFNRAYSRVLKAGWNHIATVDLRYTNGFAITEKAATEDKG